MSTYTSKHSANMYHKLLAEEVRLITIEPSNEFNDQVRCHLDHFDISDQFYTSQHRASLAARVLRNSGNDKQQDQSLSEDWVLVDPICDAVATSNLPEFRYVWGDYMALSYTWGDLTASRTILVNDIAVQVTENLEAALKILRTKPYIKAGWKIWIDAICINQKDIIERGMQVKRMRNIYRKAWTPIIWLGVSSVDSHQAINLICNLAAGYDCADTLVETMNRYPEAFGKGCWRAFHDFAVRKFWLRAWILQEVSLGKANMPVLCGDQCLRWTDIDKAFELANKTDEFLNIYVSRELEDAGRSLDFGIYETLGIVGEINKYQEEMESGTDSFDLFRVMTLSRPVSATDPRDKIYGLLALMDAELTGRIQPDYHAPVEEIYTSYAKITIEAMQSLEILRHVGTRGSLSLPSWVPDWTSSHLTGSLGDTPHTTSGNTTAQVWYPQPGLLSCYGFFFDTIDGMGSLWRDASGAGWPEESVRESTGYANPYRDFEGAREAIWRTMVANRNLQVATLDEEYSSLLAVPAIFRDRKILKNEKLKALALTHNLDYCNEFLKSNADFTMAGNKLSSYFISKPDYSQIDPSTLRDALIARDRVNIRRSLFTTSRGYVGIALQDALPGDLICVLFGCSMPLVLRRSQAGFRLIDECYLHGLMEGEGLDMLQRSEVVPSEFILQ